VSYTGNFNNSQVEEYMAIDLNLPYGKIGGRIHKLGK